MKARSAPVQRPGNGAQNYKMVYSSSDTKNKEHYIKVKILRGPTQDEF